MTHRGVGFDADELRRLGGDPPPRAQPVTAAYLVRIGLAAAVGAALCNLVVLTVASSRSWLIAVEDRQPVRALSVVLVCTVVGVLAAFAAYVAARVTKRPAVWVVIAGWESCWRRSRAFRSLQVMHVITGAWVIGWLGWQCAAARTCPTTDLPNWALPDRRFVNLPSFGGFYARSILIRGICSTGRWHGPTRGAHFGEARPRRPLCFPTSGDPDRGPATNTAKDHEKKEQTMAELLVIGYDNETTGRQAYNTVIGLQQDMIVELEGLALVTQDEAAEHVETPAKLVSSGAAFGALWGMLIGLLFFVPFFGLAFGGAMGALMGKMGKSG